MDNGTELPRTGWHSCDIGICLRTVLLTSGMERIYPQIVITKLAYHMGNGKLDLYKISPTEIKAIVD